MTVFLLANVGNRDVQMSKETPVPGEVHPGWNPHASRRGLGLALMANWPDCAPYLRLPIIGKAADFIRKEAGRIDRVILVSSDQSAAEGVADRYLAQDTCELAPVVERLLVGQHGVPEGAVEHWTVTTNPADYGEMQAFFRENLPNLLEDYPDAAFYLEVSGGTPAMTSMLLAVGAETFGLAAHPLYVSERAEEPFPLDLGRRTVAEALASTIRANLAIYAYHAAMDTVQDNAGLLCEFFPVDPLEAVLAYARQRVNFNFDRARAALSGVPHGPWSDRLDDLASDLHEDQAEWLLQEIVYNAEIKLRTGDYGDFLVRVFRFDEAARRTAALRLGARLVDREGQPDADGEFFDPAFITEIPGLREYLESKNVRFAQGDLAPANRYVMSCTIAFLADQQGDQAPRTLLKRLGKLDQLSKVRNASFAVHTFDGVSRQRMVQAFTSNPEALGTDAEIDEMMAVLREVCALATGEPFVAANPYDAINALVEILLSM